MSVGWFACLPYDSVVLRVRMAVLVEIGSSSGSGASASVFLDFEDISALCQRLGGEGHAAVAGGGDGLKEPEQQADAARLKRHQAWRVGAVDRLAQVLLVALDQGLAGA